MHGFSQGRRAQFGRQALGEFDIPSVEQRKYLVDSRMCHLRYRGRQQRVHLCTAGCPVSWNVPDARMAAPARAWPQLRPETHRGGGNLGGGGPLSYRDADLVVLLDHGAATSAGRIQDQVSGVGSGAAASLRRRSMITAYARSSRPAARYREITSFHQNAASPGVWWS